MPGSIGVLFRSPDDVLRAANLVKDYLTPRGRLAILSGVSLDVDAGEAAAIMGPSGSGKSSLLYILGALEPPTSGTVTLDGVDPFSLAPAALAAFRNRSVGFVFQDHCLLPQCSVLENVLVPTLVRSRSGPGGDDPAADAERARLLLGQVGLTDRLDHRPGELSGGEKQRVALARALIRHPRLVLCDEPTGNLDRTSADTVTALLLDLHRQWTTILIVVTHSAQVAARFPARYELANGILVRVSG
jgi:lipoprotein-releasing system ATP-binding protein